MTLLRSKHLHRLMITALICSVAALLVAGCGKKPGNNASGSSEAGPKVGLVTDLGGLNDRSFNALANKGLEDAKDELGAVGTVLESKSSGDYERNLGKLAQDGNQLVVGVGFLMADPIKTVSAKAPDTNFAIVDYSATALGSPKNVRGLTFKEQEAGYLAGVLAGAAESDGKLKGLNAAHIVSVVGGQKIPPVEKYIAGFQAGVKSTCKDCKIIIDYSQDFIDQAKCQDRALSQIQKGSDIIFQVAGGCGLGALDAAKQRGVWGIGVDADQAYLGPHILTSAVKHVDIAVLDTIRSIQQKQFEGGVDGVYGLAEEGVGLGAVSPAAAQYQADIDAAVAGIKAGKIDIPTEVK